VLLLQLNIHLARNIARRNLLYVRYSWTRIATIALAAFWITFELAETGVEHGRYHIGVFRALSVLRAACLLTITSSMMENKTGPFGIENLTMSFLCRPRCAHSRQRACCTIYEDLGPVTLFSALEEFLRVLVPDVNVCVHGRPLESTG